MKIMIANLIITYFPDWYKCIEMQKIAPPTSETKPTPFVKSYTVYDWWIKEISGLRFKTM